MKQVKIAPSDKPEDKDKDKPNKVSKVLVFLLSMIVHLIGICPVKYDKKKEVYSFKLISWTSFWAFVRLLVFNAPLTIVPVALLVSGSVSEEVQHSGLIEEWKKSNITFEKDVIYDNDMVRMTSGFQYLACYLYYALPFVLSCPMAMPMTNILKVVRELTNKEMSFGQMFFPIKCTESLKVIYKVENALKKS